MSTPAEVRRRAGRKRAIGRWAIALALLPALAAVYVFVLNVQVVGGGVATLWTNCGALVEPVVNQGAGAGYCAQALGEQALFVWVFVIAAVVLAVSGIVLLVRTPRYSQY